MNEQAQANVRGADNLALAANLGRAIRAAQGEMSQSELSRRTGIDQPTLSKLVRGVRRTPLTVWEMLTIEQAAGRPPGFILRQAGLITRSVGIREALLSEPDLPELARRMLIAASDAAMGSGLGGRAAAAPRLDDDEQLAELAERVRKALTVETPRKAARSAKTLASPTPRRRK